MKTRAKDRIELSSGEVMTMGEAVRTGRVVKVALDADGAATADLEQAKRFIAKELGSDCFWEIGRTYFAGKFEQKPEVQE